MVIYLQKYVNNFSNLLKRLTTPPPLRPWDFSREWLQRGTISISKKSKVEECKQKITESRALKHLSIM